MFCGCPPDPLLCEDFEEFEEGTFPDWVVPGGQPPQQVPALCGQAFRGEIGPGEGFAVVSRAFPGITANGDSDVVRLSGVMRIEPGCAADTPHRLVSARLDGFNNTFLYSADIELEEGVLHLVQRLPSPAVPEVHELGFVEEGEPRRFDIVLAGLQFLGEPAVSARVGTSSTSAPRPTVPQDGLSFHAVPGPFAYLNENEAGCTVEFDDIAVETLAKRPSPP